MRTTIDQDCPQPAIFSQPKKQKKMTEVTSICVNPLLEEQQARIDELQGKVTRLEDSLRIESLRRGKFLALIAPLVDGHDAYDRAHIESIQLEVRYKMRMFNWCFDCKMVCCEGDCHV